MDAAVAILASVLLLLAFLVLAECSTSGQFVVSVSLRDKSCPTYRQLFHVTNVNMAACSYLCWRRDECLSVVYQRDNHTCVGCSGGFPALSDSHETVHRCEVLYEVEPYHTVGGMKLRIVTNDEFDYDAAEDACSAQGALVKLDTIYKKQALHSFLRSDNGFRDTSFWIQCRYNVTAGLWMYDNGTRLMDDILQLFLDDGDTVDGHCCQLWRGYYHNPDNTRCTNRKGYICEYN